MCIMYVGLEYMWWRRPRKYLKVLYCTVKISDGFIVGHFFCPKFFASNVFIFFHFPDSSLSELEGFHFLLLLSHVSHVSENRE